MNLGIYIYIGSCIHSIVYSSDVNDADPRLLDSDAEPRLYFRKKKSPIM